MNMSKTNLTDTVTMCNIDQSIPNMTVAKLTVDLRNIRVDALRLRNYTTFSRSYFKHDLSNFLNLESVRIRMIETIPTTYLKLLTQAFCWW